MLYCIGSHSINVTNFSSTTNVGANQYRFNFLTQERNKPINIESVNKPHFSYTKDWTALELNQILHLNRVPPWGKELIKPVTHETQKPTCYLG